MLKLITNPNIFAGSIVGLQVLASGAYAWQGSWAKTVYWGSAAVLNTVVTWWLK